MTSPPCKCCGSPAPDPERRIPIGTQYVGTEPRLVLWLCPGAKVIDAELIRYGIIVHRAYSCHTTRGTWWDTATQDLRHRSLEADRMRLAMAGLV